MHVFPASACRPLVCRHAAAVAPVTSPVSVYVPAVAEGDAYGNDSGGGNSTFYSLQAVISAGAAGFFGLAPYAVRSRLRGKDVR